MFLQIASGLIENSLRELDIDIGSNNYKKLLPIREPKMKDHYNVLANDYYQMDLMEMTPDNEYKYILNIVNMKTRICDVQPMKTKEGDGVLKAFVDILKRNVIIFYPKLIYCDNGGEFINNRFKNYCASVGIGLVFTRPGNHKQNAIVEASNNIFKKILLRYLSVKSYEKNEYVDDWVEVLFKVRDMINEHFTTNPVQYRNLLVAYDGNEPKYKIGEEVYIKIDHPQMLLLNGRMHGDYFRNGDRRFSNQKYKVNGFKMPNGGNLRYQIKNEKGDIMYGNYLENELLPVRG